jgi:acetyl-CoA C-acetyltransferase
VTRPQGELSIKDKVAIVGVGSTKFGENFDMSYDDLLVEAVYEAVEDAGIEPKDIQAAWLSTAFPDAGVYKGRSGMDLADATALFDIPITRVSNYCAAAGDALRNAMTAILSGMYDIVLAVGVEKLRDRPPRESLISMNSDTGHPFFQKGVTAPGMFAILATRHMHRFGTTKEDLALVSVKNHRHGALNPKAQHGGELDIQTVLNAPPVAGPLGVLDCCPTTDGAAAAILMRTEEAKAQRKDYVTIKGQGFVTSGGYDSPFYDPDYDLVGWPANRLAAEIAYQQAGIRDPLKEIDVAEVHDCFTITEIATCEDLGFCPKGEGARLVREGVTTLGGELPLNTSGGLLSCGHPIGASGLRMIYNLTKQLQGKAGKMQVPGAKLALAHNLGGPGAVVAVTILGAP